MEIHRPRGDALLLSSTETEASSSPSELHGGTMMDSTMSKNISRLLSATQTPTPVDPSASVDTDLVPTGSGSAGDVTTQTTKRRGTMRSRRLRVLDLFCGLRGWSEPFEARGHEIFAIDWDESFSPDLAANLFDVDADRILRGPTGSRPWTWKPDVILASPPCEKFSVMTISRNWTKDHEPRTEEAALALRLVEHTIGLIRDLDPAFFIIENPVGKLRRLVRGIDRRTVTYCQYGAPWRKPTDLWGGFPPSLELRPQCAQGAPCHVASPRGSMNGIQANSLEEGKVPEQTRLWLVEQRDKIVAKRLGLRDNKRQVREIAGTSNAKLLAAIRAKIPETLALDVCLAVEKDAALGGTWRSVQDRLFA